jgi:hypothetical protein
MLDPRRFRGAELTLIRRYDVEGDHNRGWRADLIELLVDGNRAGYIRATFIPVDRWASWYLDHPAGPVVAWLDQMEGGPFQSDGATPEQMWSVVRDHFGIPSKVAPSGFGAWLSEKRRRSLTAFQAYHVDKPIVDYIRVYQEHDDNERIFPGNRGNAFVCRSALHDYSRLGLGRLLYTEMSAWLSESGLKFYASSLQSPEAAAAWERLKKLHGNAVGYETFNRFAESYVRFFLDGSRLSPLHPPDWVGSVRRLEMPGEDASETPDRELAVAMSR